MTASHTALSAETAVSANRDLVSVRVGAVEVLRARFDADAVPPSECRTPYLHPLRTLSGGVVTGHRPHDHRWHKGLTMAVPKLAVAAPPGRPGRPAAASNFWGGPSYVTGRGYVDLDDAGRIETSLFETAANGSVAADLVWIGADGVPVLSERRTFAVRDVDREAGCWTLEFRSELRTLGADPVEFKSPTVLGRELAGYCGFFWRGPRAFTGGRVLAANGLEGADTLMGRRAEWLAYIGEFDERDGFATLVFVPEGEAPEWFVRGEDYPGVNPSLAFGEPLPLAPGEVLALGYRVVIADGAWSRERIEDYLRPGLTAGR
ncbi:PmoA family protein [Catenulispora sp. NF23]|uniref:PmoA family protein n=1 Tax=Catenulispora pinistramenti TaxID=2705254 RepID=A0ABS5KY91_9ACTN|nr:PmoA family protein [Catenulispora pinistramenti]MBS2531768.1 PmoA family protein [Catenulispora pinistramenti]MBS2550934.1 PmoA family protein [Catenulispora pinistramenti]